MNNHGNINKLAELAASQKSGNPNEFVFKPGEKIDLSAFSKDPKMDFDNLNDIMMNNIFGGGGHLNSLLEKNAHNQDLLAGANAQNPNLSIDPNLLYNFSNSKQNPFIANQALNSTDLSSQGNLYFPNNGLLFPNNLNLNNMYEDMMKNSNTAEYLYGNNLGIAEKNLLGHAVLGDGVHHFDNKLLLPGLEDVSFLPQEVGPGGLNGPFGNLPNPMLLNNFGYGGELGFNNLLLQQNLGLEDLYQLQQLNPGGLQFGGLPDFLLDGHGNAAFNYPGQPGLGPNAQASNHNHETNESKNASTNPYGLNLPMNKILDFNENQSNLLKYIMGPQGGQQDSQKPGATKPPTNPTATSNAPKQQVPESSKPNPTSNSSNLTKNNDMELLSKGMLDPFMINGSGKAPNLGNLPNMNSMGGMGGMGGMGPSFGMDEFFMGQQGDMLNKLKEKNRYERSLKIEKYKNKKRNWQRKISYDCRKRVADTRLRIKGRFISKKDSEKINKLVEGKQEEAFNDKKNLNLDYITNKFNIIDDGEEIEKPTVAKPTISKKFLLTKIDEILSNDKNPLPPKNAQKIIALGERIKVMLENKSKKIFKISSRKFQRELSFSRSSSPESKKGPSTQNNNSSLTQNNSFTANLPSHLQGLMENNPYLNFDIYNANSQLSMQIAKMNAQLSSMQQQMNVEQSNEADKKATISENNEQTKTSSEPTTQPQENGQEKLNIGQLNGTNNANNMLISNQFFQNFFNQSFMNQPGLQNSLLNMTSNQSSNVNMKLE